MGATADQRKWRISRSLLQQLCWKVAAESFENPLNKKFTAREPYMHSQIQRCDIMLNKIVLWIIFIGPWLSLIFMKKESIKRYMPVAIFATMLMMLYNVYSFNEKHWEIHEAIFPALRPLFASGILGGFPVITLWIFHFTYRKFWIYLLTNIVLDFMFAVFPVHFILQDVLGIYKLNNISSWERWLLFVAEAVIIYGYFKWQENIHRS